VGTAAMTRGWQVRKQNTGMTNSTDAYHTSHARPSTGNPQPKGGAFRANSTGSSSTDEDAWAARAGRLAEE